jgi:hypothetical protein
LGDFTEEEVSAGVAGLPGVVQEATVKMEGYTGIPEVNGRFDPTS